MSEFQLIRLGLLMEPEPGNPNEVEGVLNPAAARGPDGNLYLFPRLVAKGNYSRIGLARVKFDQAGNPSGVERLGIALEPEAEYECHPGGGGCEDPRVTYVEPLQHYVMTYTAFSPNGPRIAIATSENLIHWTRLGLATFSPYKGMSFDGIDNKDACVFPVAVPDPEGRPAFAILHRPLFPGSRPEETVHNSASHVRNVRHESIWISYRDMNMKRRDPEHRRRFTSHHRLASPVAPWENLKIGLGAPPVLTRVGWLVIYHGVSRKPAPSGSAPSLTYSAGVMILDKENPRKILYRSPSPVLIPDLPEERVGTIGNVVFPTGADRRDDIGLPNRIDVYYGMADDKIGVARLDVPETLGT